MSVPLGFKKFLELDGLLWLLEAGSATKVDSIVDIAGPKVIVSDFNHALTGIEDIMAGKNYAPAIIDKQLRDRGDMEGASQVLVLKSEKKAAASEIFYAAVPVNSFTKYIDAVKKQKDHCLYVPLWSAMLSCAKKGISAIIVQHGDVLELIISDSGCPLLSMRVSSSSYEGQDWESALGYLASELNQFENDQGSKIESIQWMNWAVDASSLSLAEKFSELSSRELDSNDLQEFKIDDLICKSRVQPLYDNLSTSDAVKIESTTYLYNFEKALPWVAGLALAISAGAFMAGLNWQNSAQGYQDSASEILVSSEYESKYLRAKDLADNRLEINKVLSESEANLIGDLATIAESKSIPEVMADIKSSVTPFVHVTKIALDRSDSKPYKGFMVNGHVDQELDFASQQIQIFINKLMGLGYDVQDNGFIAKSGNNGFQLVLTPNNAI